MRYKKLEKFNIWTHQVSSFSTDSTVSTVDSKNSKNNSKVPFSRTHTHSVSLNESYLSLMQLVFNELKLKDSKMNPLVVTLNVEDLKEMDDINMSLNVKTFNSNVRLSAKNSFDRNFLEILLLPISKNITLDKEALYLSPTTENFKLYESLIVSEEVRSAFFKFISEIPELKNDLINIKTTIKDLKSNTMVKSILEELKTGVLSQNSRYKLLGLFLESILFETVDNIKGGLGHSRYMKFVIDLIYKSTV
jgi:hypothetical protein